MAEPGGDGRQPAGPAASRPLLERLGSAGATAASLGGERSRWRRWAVGVLALLAVVCLTLFVATQWSRLPDIRWRLQPGWLAICVVALAGFQALQAQLWGWILHGLGSRLAMAKAWSIFSVTLLARYVPTNLALVVGRTAMGEREGVPKRVTLAGIVYQLGLTFAGAAAVGAYFVIVLPQLSGQPVRFAALALPVIALVALDPRVFHRLADVALQRMGRDPLPLSLSRGRVLVFLVLYGLTMVIAGLGVYAFAQAIHPVGGSHVASVVASYSVGFAVSLLAFVLPGGLGAREAAMAAALSPAVGLTVGIAVAVAVRLEQMVIELVFAGVTPLAARRATGRRITAPPPASDG